MKTLYCHFLIFLLLATSTSAKGVSKFVTFSEYLDTVQGGCNYFNTVTLKTTRADLIQLGWRGREDYSEQPFTYYGGLHKGDFFTKKKRKRDMVFIISGVLGLARSIYSKALGGAYFRSGYNVIQLPGPYGSEHMPKHYTPKSLEDMGRQYQNIIRDTVAELERRGEKVGKVVLVGVSMGAFAAAVATSLDGEEDSLISKTILLSPVLSLKASISLLDKAIGDVIEEIKPPQKGLQWIEDIADYFKYCISKKELDQEEELELLKADFLNITFIRDYYKVLKKVIPRKMLPPNEDDLSFDYFKKNYPLLSFTSMLKMFLTDGQEILNGKEQGFLSFWLNSIRSEVEIKIVATENDFLTLGSRLSLLKGEGRDVLILPRGGHVGYWRNPRFWHFMFGCSESFRCHEVEF